MDRAVDEFGVDPAHSFTVGDRWADVGLARAMGGHGVLVRTGYGAKTERAGSAALRDAVVTDSLVEAVSWILADA